MLTISGPALIVMILVAAMCGAIGRAIAGGTRGGLITATALGFIGALLGAWMSRQLRLPEPFVLEVAGRPFPILWSIIGAALFVTILHLLTRPRWLIRT